MPRSADAAAREITVVFKDRFLTFPLPPNATLEDLAMQLAGIGKRIAGLPVYIDVRAPG